MRTFKKYRISTNYVNHAKVEIQKCVILLKHFRSSTDFFFFFFFFEVTIFYKIFPKMSENLSAKYCQDNKERLQRKPREKY